MIRPARLGDASAIAAIYAPYVTHGTATFEIEPPDAATIAERMAASGGRLPWLVCEEAGRVIGYAYAAPFHARAAYCWTVETTVYLAAEAHGRGVGRGLYAALLYALTAQGFAQAVALVSRPNPASEALHAALGFRPAGTIERAGYKHGQWIDVGYWQRALADPGDPPAEAQSVAIRPDRVRSVEQ